jgi:hypothetical protein
VAGLGDGVDRRRAWRSEVSRPRRTRWGPAAAIVTGLLLGAACGPLLRGSPPGPSVPRIADFQVTPVTVPAGCPVHVRFRFDDADGDVVRAVLHVRSVASVTRRSPQAAYVVLPIDDTWFDGRVAGEATAWVTLPHGGHYLYRLQIEDRAGHLSNGLDAAVIAVAPSPGDSGPPVCDTSVPQWPARESP